MPNLDRHKQAINLLKLKVLSKLTIVNDAHKLKESVTDKFSYTSGKRNIVIAALATIRRRVAKRTLLCRIRKSTQMTYAALHEHLKRLKNAGVVKLTNKDVLLLRPRSRPVLLMPAPKPFPVSSKTGCERKTISRTELRNRNWSSAFIHFLFDEEGTHVRKMHMPAQWDSTKTILCRYYRVALIKDLELSPEFHELRRAMNAAWKKAGSRRRLFLASSDPGLQGQQMPAAHCDPTDSYREAA